MNTLPALYLATSEKWMRDYKVRALINAGYSEQAALMAANWATEVLKIAFNTSSCPIVLRTRLGGMRLDARKVEIQ